MKKNEFWMLVCVCVFTIAVVVCGWQFRRGYEARDEMEQELKIQKALVEKLKKELEAAK